jgi:biopolymer transport protein ExbD
MAGASMDDEDNPVSVNVVPLIDIIFCLCVFFMCSFRFKLLEGKFESWLPKNKGGESSPVDRQVHETRVAIFWDSGNQRAVRYLGNRQVNDDAELQRLIKESHEDHVRLGNPDAPVIIDAQEQIPMKEIIRVVNLVKRENINAIEFAMAIEQNARPGG